MFGNSDAELIRRAKQGDGEAAGLLYNRYHEHVFKFIWARVQNKQTAEDLTGEVFTRMMMNLPTYRERGVPFAAWLYRIARNLVIDHQRQWGGRFDVPLDERRDKDKTDPVEIVAQRIEVERIFRAMGHLKDVEQEVIIMRFVVGLSLLEVAETLDKHVGTVKTLQHRGLKALRMALHRNEWE